MASVLKSQHSLARRLVFRANCLLALAFVSVSACGNSDKLAQPQPEKPTPVTPEAKSDVKAAEEKAAESKKAEEKAAAEKAVADKAAADKAAADKAAAKPADSSSAEAPKAEAKPGDTARAPAGDVKKAAEPSKTAVAKATKLESKTGVLAKGEADKYVKKGARPVIRLLDPGAEPRIAAAYSFTKGTAKPLQMAMDVEMGMEAGELKVPPSKMPRMLLVFDFKSGDKSGTEWPIEGTLTKISLDPQGPQQEQVAGLLRPQLGAVQGLGMSYFLDERGRTREVKVKLPPTLPPIADQMMSGLTQSVESMTSPLPEEAVGVGAKWEVMARIVANGADLLQVTTYTLEKRDGQVLSLDTVVRQFAAKDTVTPPGMPPGASARLTSYKCQGTGNPVFDLGDVAPSSGSVNVNTAMDIEIKMDVEGKAEKQTTSVTTKMSATYSRVAP
jgi:hypothetical protein